MCEVMQITPDANYKEKGLLYSMAASYKLHTCLACSIMSVFPAHIVAMSIGLAELQL